MSTIVVAGTSIQAAIDKALPGDVLSLTAGTYAGRLKIGKPLTIDGGGSAIIDGGQGDGFINIAVASKGVTVRGCDVRHAGAAFRFSGDCTGSLVEHCVIPIVDFMVVNTAGGNDDNGGNAFQMTKATGVTVQDVQARSLRATSLDYTRDGGFADLFAAHQITFRRCEVWDSVNIIETGKNTADADNSDLIVEDCTFHGRPDPTIAPSATTVANGLYLRALVRASIARNVFDRIDWWNLLFSAGGSFGGSLSGITVLDNTFRLLPGVSRVVTTNFAPVPGAIVLDRSRIWCDAGTTIAKLNTTDGIKDLAPLQAVGWETHNAGFGTEPPVAPPPPPVDPCGIVKADLAAASAALLLMTEKRDALAAVVANVRRDVA